MEEFIDKQRIVATPGTCGGRPRIADTRIRVQDVYLWHELGGRSPRQIVDSFPHLTLAEVHAALAYYFDHEAEIKQQLIDDEKFVEEMKAKMGPGPLAAKLQQMEAARASAAS